MGRAGCLVMMPALLVACTATPAPTTPVPEVEPPETTPAVSSTSAAASTTAAATVPTVPTATSSTTTLPELGGLALQTTASGLTQPTVVTHRPGDDRLYVVERNGVIRVVAPDEGLRDEPLLDLRDRVGSNGIEQGMLGLAFHPVDANRFFVYYTDTEGRRTLSEFSGPSSDRDAEVRLFSHSQPAASVDIRHYGGHLQFGPDGYLYVALGDGADGANQGQDADTVFGTILRLDVDEGDPYAIPSGNPFPEGDSPEVWAYGLRNPWRFTIDGSLIYIADVGQTSREEVNVVSLDEGGGNFGWPVMEGTSCFSDPECDPGAFEAPVLEYGHEEGCSITGGHVYRGKAIPELDGHYFYGDWCGEWVRSFRLDEGEAVDHRDWSADLEGLGQPNAFGVDSEGEMYVANYAGEILRIVPLR